MSRAGRLVLFALACACVLPGVVEVALHMPTFGDHALPYGDLINATATAQRHVTNMVSAVNFDYRGFDTLGEEFMLVCAVTGTVVLLRSHRGEQTDAAPGRVEGRRIPPRSDALVAISRFVAPIIILFGLYVALHAMTTPGGGFQGGVIVASGFLLLFLGEGYHTWRKVIRSKAFDAFEGVGAAVYAVCGLPSIVAGSPYLTNILPLGKAKDVFSGGLMLVANGGVAFAVVGGFAILLIEFMEETRRTSSEP